MLEAIFSWKKKPNQNMKLKYCKWMDKHIDFLPFLDSIKFVLLSPGIPDKQSDLRFFQMQ